PARLSDSVSRPSACPKTTQPSFPRRLVPAKTGPLSIPSPFVPVTLRRSREGGNLVGLSLPGKLLDPPPRRRGIEARLAAGGELERALVVLQGELRLAQVIEAHREVVRVVGVLRVGRERLEVLLLGLGPARLAGELVA